MKNKIQTTLCAAACLLLAACGTTETQKDKPEPDYPTITKDGKRYKIIPAADWLMRTEVPVPVAPNTNRVSIRVSPQYQRAWLYRYGMLDLTAPICAGKPGHETPTGTFRVIAKHRDWISTIYHVEMPFFLRLNASQGKVGLHAGAIALQGASHGCIRLPKPMAEAFFNATPIGTIVVVDRTLPKAITEAMPKTE